MTSSKFRSIAKTLSIPALVLGVGVGSVLYLNSIPPRNPSITDYSNYSARDIEGNIIEDIDNDGNADLIRSQGVSRYLLWVAPDKVNQLGGEYYRTEKTPRMTPEIQGLATKVMQDQKRLRFIQDSTLFTKYQIAKKAKK